VVAALVARDQAPRPIVITCLEVTDVERHAAPPAVAPTTRAQEPRYVLIPYGLSSRGTWYERPASAM
jgi:hypothetical protein